MRRVTDSRKTGYKCLLVLQEKIKQSAACSLSSAIYYFLPQAIKRTLRKIYLGRGTYQILSTIQRSLLYTSCLQLGLALSIKSHVIMCTVKLYVWQG